MCTLSWQLMPKGYEVFFNRDEQVTRPKAIDPQFDNALQAIYPIDPQAGGTWIATNKMGSTYCLLNNYQASEQALLKGKKAKRSRGLIIIDLLSLCPTKPEKEIEQVQKKLTPQYLADFAPFTLCVFTADTSTKKSLVNQLDWNGEQLSLSVAQAPLTSSGFNFTEVKKARLATYQAMKAQSQNGTLDLLVFHASHQPAKEAYSVCMHRDDAQTQSLTHIIVSNEHVQFNYRDTSPCLLTEFKTSSMQRMTHI
ncbi:NRDE family protein [Algibacillus agarilyticus]|uniref:NRDE family protein n=1 Tax=Algibacillus agarilyticus TaxID=2234133 RepID=UPI000DD005CC|nr:NRDE family protein [Algibacillus agarilyticus]